MEIYFFEGKEGSEWSCSLKKFVLTLRNSCSAIHWLNWREIYGRIPRIRSGVIKAYSLRYFVSKSFFVFFKKNFLDIRHFDKLDSAGVLNRNSNFFKLESNSDSQIIIISVIIH